jgi:hypothetical protein
MARRNLADWLGLTGQRAEAEAGYRELVPDLERVLGPDHPDTLRARQILTHWRNLT